MFWLLFERSSSDAYEKNINLFMSEMDKYNLSYSRYKNGNTFIIDLPSIEFAAKYQLAPVAGNKAHIIIFPSHKEEAIRTLVSDLAKCYGYTNNLIKKLEKN